MATLATPGVYVELTDAPPDLDPVAVDVAAFAGVFERGPVDVAVRVTSWPQIVATFGGFTANGIGAYALKGWLDNGGRVAWVVRVAAPAHTTAAAGAQPDDRRRSVLAALDGLVPGAAVAVRAGGATWMHVVRAVDAATGTVTWDRPLHPDIDLSAPGAVLQTGAAPADAVLAGDASSAAALLIAARSAGAWGNALSVRVAHSFDAAARGRSVPAPTAAATAVESTDGFAPGMVARISQDGGAPAERRVVAAVDRATSTLVWNAPLGAVDPSQPLRVEAESFTLSVRESGRLREVFAGLTLVAGQPRYAPLVLAQSALVSAVAPAPPPVLLPLPAAGGWVALAGGRDGTAALGVSDLVGDESADIARGIAAFAAIDEPAILALPDLVAEPVAAAVSVPPAPAELDPCDPRPPPAPPPETLVAEVSEGRASFDAAAIAAVQRAMVDHCERRGDRVALLDPPCAAGPLDVSALTAWRDRSHSSYAAAYAPWVRVIDPLGGASTLRRLPPSGHVAGLLARVDDEVGPWLAPANRVLRWAHDTDAAIDDAGHGILNDAGIAVLRAQAGRGVAVLGARTVASDAQWRFLPVRRLFLLLERTLRAGLAWTAFEPAGPALERAMTVAIRGLLEGLWERGAFAGPSPESSFFVAAREGDRLRGEVRIDIGVAVQHPIERILLQVVRAEDRLEIRELPERGD